MRRVVLNVELECCNVSKFQQNSNHFHQKLDSDTHNGGILYLMLGSFGGGKTPLHKAVSIQLTLGEDSSIFGT